MNLFTFPIDGQSDPAKLFAPLADTPYSLFFDSADRKHPQARYSFIASHPVETIEAKDGKITVRNKDQQLSFTGNPFRAVKERLESRFMDIRPRDDMPPFQCGAAGFFGYDLARCLEKLPAHAPGNSLPDMAIGIYDRVLAFDHARKKSWCIMLAEDERRAGEKFRALMKAVNAPCPRRSVEIGEWRSNFTEGAYEPAVQKVIDYISAGDIFQANLSQRFEADTLPGYDAYTHYLNLRRVNPAPFASYMNFGGFSLSSASPERFLNVTGRTVEARPIKGTRPRSADQKRDRELADELRGSEKDRAENVMIVDLLRNDLSKVCDDFSVDVPALCELESFAKIHHLVSTVTGTLRGDSHAADLLESCFPGGSITGAPKVRAMEIIDELESQRRGPYCGAMGYISCGGNMDASIAIRTLVHEPGHEPGKVWFNVGGGITADSGPAEEYRETLDKAAAIFNSFGMTQRRNAATG